MHARLDFVIVLCHLFVVHYVLAGKIYDDYPFPKTGVEVTYSPAISKNNDANEIDEM